MEQRPKTSWNSTLSVKLNYWSTVLRKRVVAQQHCFSSFSKFISPTPLHIFGKECFVWQLFINWKSLVIHVLIMANPILTKKKRQQWPCSFTALRAKQEMENLSTKWNLQISLQSNVFEKNAFIVYQRYKWLTCV